MSATPIDMMVIQATLTAQNELLKVLSVQVQAMHTQLDNLDKMVKKMVEENKRNRDQNDYRH